VAGSAPRDVLLRACATQQIPWTKALSPLLGANLLRATAEHDLSWRVYHHRFQTHLLQKLDQPEAVHGVLARAYRGSPRPERYAEALLLHYSQAGDRSGRHWALQTAADQATKGLAFGRAATHHQALLLEYPSPADRAASAWEEVARGYSLAGMLEEATAAREHAIAACASEPTTLRRLWAQQGQDLCDSRQQGAAMDAWRRALRPLGLQPLRSTLRTLASVLVLRAQVALVDALPVGPAPNRTRTLRAEAHFWEQLAVALANTSFLALSEFSERARLAAHRAGSPRSAALSEILSLTSGTMANPSESNRSAAQRRLGKLAERLDAPSPWEQATLLAGQGMLQLQVDPDLAARTFLQAYQAAQRAGMADSSMGAMIEAYVCNAAVDAGRYDEALAHCAHLERRRCRDTGTHRHGVLITATLTRARVAFFRGQVGPARSTITEAEARVPDSPMTVERQVLLALQMKLQILDGDPAGALRRYHTHRAALRRAGFDMVALTWSRAAVDVLDANLALVRLDRPLGWSTWRLRRLARKLATRGWPIWRCAGFAALAELAWRSGDMVTAHAELERALAQSARVFEPHYRWRCLRLAETMGRTDASAERSALERRFGLAVWPGDLGP
jgi:hypothetical protein